MTVLPLSRRVLTVLDLLIVVALFIGLKGRAWLWLLCAGVLLVIRIAHGLRFPRRIDQLTGEDLSLATVESGREWLPIRDRDRALLTSYQILLLDEVASLLERLSSPRCDPATSVWRKPSGELQIQVPIDGRGVVGLKSWFRGFGTAFIGYGTVDEDDQYDYEFLEKSEVVFWSTRPTNAIEGVLDWLRNEIQRP